MDIRALLQFVANHVEQIFGTTLVLFFVTCLLLLIRSIGSKKEGDSHGTVTATIDAHSVEEAVRRALNSHGPLVASGNGGGGSIPEGASPENINQAIRERDARIEQLSKELEMLRSQVANAAAGPEAGVIGISDSELAELRAKLDEMQARLSEYEIIEDDIADLSMFKEENARLKTEIDDLRLKLSNLSTIKDSPAIVQQAPAAIPTSALSDLSPPAEPDDLLAAIATNAPSSTPSAASSTPASDDDDVMREFAAAVQVQKAPPAEASSAIPVDAASIAAIASSLSTEDMKTTGDALAAFAGTTPKGIVTEDPQAAVDAILAEAESKGAVAEKPAAEATDPDLATGDVLAGETDPDKMLSEVASLEAAVSAAEGAPEDASASAPSALDDSLDTDKLLAEVGSLATQNARTEDQADSLNGDDLLSEFTGQAAAGPSGKK